MKNHSIHTIRMLLMIQGSIDPSGSVLHLDTRIVMVVVVFSVLIVVALFRFGRMMVRMEWVLHVVEAPVALLLLLWFLVVVNSI